MSAGETQGFTRMVLRKNLIWERDSLARTMYDPEHIPNCNVKATVGKHFLFNERVPRSENEQGYLRVTRSSPWMWKGPSLDLLHQVYEETQHQDHIEACGYRSATWRILRALKSINGGDGMGISNHSSTFL
jgi:hypothetical protein